MTRPPIWNVFGSFLRGDPKFSFNKTVPHGFEQIRFAMATGKLQEKVKPHDEDAESSKTGCRSPSREVGIAHGVATISKLLKIIGLFCKRAL